MYQNCNPGAAPPPPGYGGYGGGQRGGGYGGYEAPDPQIAQIAQWFNAVYQDRLTSQKHRNFVAEPMGDKNVNDLAGIGDVLGKRLEAKGFDKANTVLGQFLLLKKNKYQFVEWIKYLVGANTKQAADCYQCLSDWCDEFL